MNDLISRADALTVLSWYTQTDPLGHTPCQLIEALPSVDAVEVVRCKDCKNWDTTWQNDDWAKNYHYCPFIDGTRNGDWFCADGEREEE